MADKPRNPHEIYCLENAAYFTAVRWAPRRKLTRIECPTLDAARAKAAEYGDGRTMIYAVTADGRDAHVENA